MDSSTGSGAMLTTFFRPALSAKGFLIRFLWSYTGEIKLNNKNKLSNLVVIEICELHYKSFTIITYDYNDSGQYYKTTIMIVSYSPNSAFALVSVTIYDCK